ncbi:MAG: hypothetical protein IKV52_04615 [Oscillospiraceae bacterium]|nr:hypothetical protein [Oscillospiraceae bacterium]
MKKILALVLAFAMAMSMVACSSAPASSESTEESTETTQTTVKAPETELFMFVDGADVTDGNTTYDSVSAKFAETEIEGIKYTGTTLTNLCAYDISTVVGVFAEAADGFVRYYAKPADVSVILGEAEGVPAWGTVVPGQDPIYGIANIYMVTTAAEFNVPVKVNGEEIGVITMSDFMKKTPVGDKKVTTAMFDGSFKYKGGEATYTGKFLGINYETMVAKLAALGMNIEGTVVECEVYGTPGMGAEGKNTEISKYPDEKSFYENLEFFVMYDGMTNNKAIKDVPMGLSAFINGTGQKWVTYNLTEINFITE